MHSSERQADAVDDILIIGAGIHGAAVAREAVAAGYRVRVLEQYATPARGTSSKSSKLIHGGLRYLESGQFALVRECLQEQRTLLDIAPHLARRNAFHIPLAAGMRRPAWQIHAGLMLYALLGGRWPRRRDSTLFAVDGLRSEAVRSLLAYSDVQTDDAALTAAVLHSAQLMGAAVAFNTCVTRIRRDGEARLMVSARTAERAQEREQDFVARIVINCSGPWINQLLACVQPAVPPAAVELVRGTHIELPQRPQQGAYYCEADDGRAVFVLPWKDRRLVGTTEAPYSGDPAQVQPTESEIAYLLHTHARWFSNAFTRQDVLAAWSGLRVLPRGTGSAFSRPREAVFLRDEKWPRLISLIGGKLTSHRATARQILQQVRPLLPAREVRFDTGRQLLPMPGR